MCPKFEFISSISGSRCERCNNVDSYAFTILGGPRLCTPCMKKYKKLWNAFWLPELGESFKVNKKHMFDS